MSVVECRTADDVRRLARSFHKPPQTPVVRLPTRARQPQFMDYSGNPETCLYDGQTIKVGKLQPRRNPTLAEILRAVCEHYSVPEIDILSHRRTASVVRPRQMFVYLARTLTTRSLPQIGAFLEGRDHTTALHAVRKITKLIGSLDAATLSDIATIKARLGVAE